MTRVTEVKSIKLNSGANMPVIGFGTWQILFRTSQKVLQALQTGYRLLDTAKIYGNEKGVGEAIRNSGIDRGEIFVTTKLWNGDQGYDHAHKAFEASLQRLGLDYIDLYLIHWPGFSTVRRRESWRALQEIYKSGRAKAIGVSNYMVKHIHELLEYAEVPPAVNQIEFHPFVYSQQRLVLELCQQQGIIIEAYSPLARGYTQESTIQSIAQVHKASLSQVMLAWAMAHQTVPIPKSSNLERMRENLEAVHVTLTGEDIRKLNNLSQNRW